MCMERQELLLKILAKESRVFEDAAGNETDRALGIIAVCWLDSLLEKLLRAYFVKEHAVDAMFRSEHMLSTYASKVSLAFALGLIMRFVYNDLRTIGEIRNKFAHELSAKMKFSDPQIVSKIDRFEVSPSAKEDEIPSPRLKYFNVVIVMGGMLSFLEALLPSHTRTTLVEVLRLKDRPYKNILLTKSEIEELVREAKRSSN